MKCANCPNEAAYLVDEDVTNALAFCRACLPPHLTVRADAGQFPLPEVKAPKK